MGCSIHGYLEYSYKKEKSHWYNWSDQIGLYPDYTLFGYLAKGVRSEPKEGFELKGLPENLSFGVSCDLKKYVSGEWIDEPNWHSHSWLTTKELSKALKLYFKNEDYVGDILEYEILLAAMKAIKKRGCIARFVFWFDS